MDQFQRTSSQAGRVSPERIRLLRRAAQFTGGIARALREDFAVLWAADAAEVKGLSAEVQELAASFRDKVDAFLAKAEQLETALKAEDTATLQRFAPEVLNATVQGLQVLSRQVKATGAPRAFGEAAARKAPTAKQEVTEASIVGWLQRLTGTVEARPLPPKPEPPPDSPLRTAFNTARQAVGKVLNQVGPELSVVGAALAGVRLPGKPRPWDEVPPALKEAAGAAGLSPSQETWLVPLAKRLYVDPMVVRKAHMAVTQYQQASAAHAKANELAPVVAKVPPERVAGVLSGFELGKYRASILPLTHLHIPFKDVPVFQKLFPAP